nr:aspartate aminotransferase family protein [Micromonospora sp. DSM 115978]
LTPAAFRRMIGLAEQFEAQVAALFAETGFGWHTVRLGCRVEYMSGAAPARDGEQAAAAFDEDLDAYLHLALLNRGVLMTPFHMMALMSPATTDTDVDTHTAALRDALAALLG